MRLMAELVSIRIAPGQDGTAFLTKNLTPVREVPGSLITTHLPACAAGVATLQPGIARAFDLLDPAATGWRSFIGPVPPLLWMSIFMR